MKALVFDVYGTLIDTHGVIEALQPFAGASAPAVSQLWRDKQLEYSFRRTAMNLYADFATCTVDALNYVDNAFELNLSENNKANLMVVYAKLPAFPEVPGALSELAKIYRCAAFSNGSQKAVTALLENAGLVNQLEKIISVDDLKKFKPDPQVYKYCADSLGLAISDCCLVSSNNFDVIGAANAGMKTVWVRRNSKMIFDSWGKEPGYTVSNLSGLTNLL